MRSVEKVGLEAGQGRFFVDKNVTKNPFREPRALRSVEKVQTWDVSLRGEISKRISFGEPRAAVTMPLRFSLHAGAAVELFVGMSLLPSAVPRVLG